MYVYICEYCILIYVRIYTNIDLSKERRTWKMTKAEKELKALTILAKQATDRKNTRLYISDTISPYIRKRISDLIRKEIELLITDKELGVITDKQLEEEAGILRVVYKSL